MIPCLLSGNGLDLCEAEQFRICNHVYPNNMRICAVKINSFAHLIFFMLYRSLLLVSEDLNMIYNIAEIP